MVPNKGEVVIPSAWDELSITSQLHLYSKEPALLSHYVFAVKERFIIGQNDRTIRRRTEFLKSVLQQATVFKELQGVSYEMSRMKFQHEIDTLDLDLQKMDLLARRDNHGKITGLKQQDEELDVQLRIEQKRRQMEELTRQAAPAPKSPSKDETRAQRKAEIERDIERLKTDKVLAVGRAKSADDRQRQENMYDDRIAELEIDLRRYL